MGLVKGNDQTSTLIYYNIEHSAVICSRCYQIEGKFLDGTFTHIKLQKLTQGISLIGGL